MVGIEEPAEVRDLRYAHLRQNLLRFWLRTSDAALIISGLFLAFIWVRLHFVPNALILLFAFGPFVISALLFFSFLLEARFSRHRCRWDDTRLIIRGHKHRWTAFQCFRVTDHTLPQGLTTFSIQFRDRFMSRGLWLSITAHTYQIEALAKAAQQHVFKER